jgi:ribonuclease Z
MAKIIFLGTASSIPTKTRDNTSFIFIHKKETFLIDCPGAIVHKLLKVGINFKKLKNVIITHQHPDHIYGIISLIHTQAYLNNHLNIFSNTPSIGIIQKMVKIFKLDRREYPKIHYTDVFKTHPFYFRDNLKLEAVKNKHIKHSFGIKFSFGNKSLLYTSDTSLYSNLLKEAEKVNYLIHDCTASFSYFIKHPSLYKMHTNAKDLANFLKDKKAILIPIHFLLLRKKEEERIEKELESLRNVLFVRDFQAISL